MTSTSDEKWRTFNCFSVQGTGGCPTAPDPEIRVGNQDIVSPVRPFSSGLQVPGEPGIVVQEQDPLGEIPAAFFLWNVLQLHQQRWIILHVDSFVLWKIINEKDAVLILPKNRGENFSSEFLHSEFFGAEWAAMPPLHWLFLCLRVVVHSQVLSMATNRDRKSFGSRQNNSKSCSDDWQLRRFWSAFRHFGTHFAESFRMSKSSWMMDPTRSREMPSWSAIYLAEIRRSSKISSWIWSIISGVVTVLGRPGRGTTQVEKSLRINWATQFLTAAYHGAFSPNVSNRMPWISLDTLPCRKKTLLLASRCC